MPLNPFVKIRSMPVDFILAALLILVRYRDCRFEAGGRRQEEVHLIILKKAVRGFVRGTVGFFRLGDD
jgi:hypothetical protein